MKAEINSKFNLGDIVQRYDKENVYELEICPFCEGKCKIPNPYVLNTYLDCPYCIKGKVRIGKLVKCNFNKTLYYIKEIGVFLRSQPDEIIYRYLIETFCEFKKTTTWAYEDDLVLADAAYKQPDTSVRK